ncbi:PAS domain S-box protein [Undibacterium rugosum]|uniref:histidine kinase n=3 Tax=Undibacterium TaxID=401469 RepID=A0A923I8I0_9BURK|nr:PAS domain S-box protein [Undibacterium rugosum]MBC3934590.1 PAS domain-containing sensor histidine kinase [Undibacterium rugosum]MBR7777204.1 PAS domain S-box protein [Undibacterium rugosum]
MLILRAALQALLIRDVLRRDQIQPGVLLNSLPEGIYRSMFYSAPDALLVHLQDGRCIDWNACWEQLNGGVASTLQEESAIFDIWVDVSQYRTQMNLLRTGQSSVSCDLEMKNPAGEIIPVGITLRQVEREGTHYFLLTLRDRRALIQAEKERDQVVKALAQREKVLSTVFQLVPDTLTITRMENGQYMDVNRNWEPLSGYSREEAIGRSSAELNLWQDFSQRDQLIQRINHDGEARNMQIAFRHKNGRISQCLVSGSRFDMDGSAYLLLSSRSIDAELRVESARQEAEQLLRESERQYADLFQMSPVPLVLLQVRSWQVQKLNDAWYREFYGDAVRDGHDGVWRQQFKTDFAPMLMLLEQLSLQRSLEQTEMSVTGLGTTHRICRMSARFLDPDASLLIVALMDVTQQVKVEKEIRELSAQLERRVVLRTRKLEQANQELAKAMEDLRYTQADLVRSEKMAALGSLVAGVAHELNTPLGNSVTVASTLQDKVHELMLELDSGKLKRSGMKLFMESYLEGLDLLMRNLEFARDLIGSFKQVAADQSSNQRRQFELSRVLEEVVVTLTPLYKKTGFHLDCTLQPGIAMDSYPGPLGQILTNFVTNSLLHGFDGKTTGRMLVRCNELDADFVEIQFSDDGVGMTESVQKKVFDPFFTTKLGHGGSGLGMHIVYNLVTQVLGGDIELSSQPGQGVLFTLRLPRIAPDLAVPQDDQVAG